jgi:hypothetical protein
MFRMAVGMYRRLEGVEIAHLPEDEIPRFEAFAVHQTEEETAGSIHRKFRGNSVPKAE